MVIKSELAADTLRYMKELFGDSAIDLSVVSGGKAGGGSEDFAFVSHCVPTVSMFLTAGSSKDGYLYSQHHPKVRFDDSVLYRGSVVTVMNDNGYVLHDLHEHAFEKSGLSLAFASIESLTSFAGIDVTKIPIIDEEGVSYYLLDLRGYLKVYTASSKDGYRKNVKNKKDEEKIKLINKALGLSM